MSSQPRADFEKQAFRTLHQDGLLEILAGLTFFICSAFVANVSLIFLIFIPVFTFAPARKWLQQRFIYPRIGYARLAEDGSAREEWRVPTLALVAFFLYLAALVGFGVSRDATYWRQWAPALAGALCCAGFLHLAGRSGLARHYFYIGASLLGGVAFSLMSFGHPYANVQFFLLALSVLMLVSGGLILRRFLRSHRPSEEGKLRGEA